MAQPKIFVSHSHVDDAFAERLVKDLKAAGADAWLDKEDLGAGDFQERISAALDKCEWFVLVLTTNALASKWVRQEVHAANSLKHRGRILDLIFMKADPVDNSDLPGLWTVYNIFDATADYDAALARTLKAIGLPQKLSSVAPQPAETLKNLMTQGTALEMQKRWSEALSFFQRAIDREPGNADAWHEKARMLFYLMRYDEALVACDSALSLTVPEDWRGQEVWNTKARILNTLGQFVEADAARQKAKRIEEGRMESRLAEHNRMLTVYPDDTDSWGQKGRVLSFLGRHEEALVAYENALALDPGSTSLWRKKGEELETLKRDGEALEAYQRALAVDPNNPVLCGIVGDLLHRQRRYEEALAVYDRALTLKEAEMFWNSKAVTLQALGCTDEAESARKRATEVARKRTEYSLIECERMLVRNPSDVDAARRKGVLLVNLQRYLEALTAFDRALTIDPNDIRNWISKGETLVALQRYSEALLTYDEALKVAETYPLLTARADVLRALGRTAEAEVAKRRAKELGG